MPIQTQSDNERERRPAYAMDNRAETYRALKNTYRAKCGNDADCVRPSSSR